MSQKLRNPFKMRASEKIETDSDFLRLYSPLALEGLKIKNDEGKLWNNILFIHSSPGAGKTSLLRIFEPQPLLTIASMRSNEHSELYNTLKNLDIFSDSGVELLGILHTCVRNYEILDDLDISEAQKKRLFFSLINSRLILSTLKGMLILKKLSFPEDLNQIEFKYKNEHNYFKNIDFPCTGKQLYGWAVQLEKNIFNALDSFLPFEKTGIEGHDELFSFEVLNPDNFSLNNIPICKKILFMLDDAHKLSTGQRESMIKYLIEKRSKATIWLSERKEVLKPQENLGAYINRDYEELNIELFLQDKPLRFEKILINVSSKRASMSIDNVRSFQENLDFQWNFDKTNESLTRSILDYKNRILELYSNYSKYDEWIRYAVENEGNHFEQAILLKAIEILINRDISKPQLDLGFSLSVEELLESIKGSIEEAAYFFVSREHNLPYYYGFSNLVKLSNNNIEQFLSFSSNLFEEMLSNNLAGKNPCLSPESQEKINKSIVNTKWKELPKIMPNSDIVMNFLINFTRFSKNETYKPNAPIVQGVTGFAISNYKSKSLFEEVNWEKDETYIQLLNVLSICIAFNLLEAREIMQGQKGQRHKVFYLNRWLCMKFDLPLAYGGWKSIKQNELLKWVKGIL
jgi:hypothetical protein